MTRAAAVEREGLLAAAAEEVAGVKRAAAAQLEAAHAAAAEELQAAKHAVLDARNEAAAGEVAHRRALAHPHANQLTTHYVT